MPVKASVRRQWNLDESLKGIDALCCRWSEQTKEYYGGSASSIWRAMREREGASLPGGIMGVSNDVMALDTVLAQAEPHYLAMVRVWYGDETSSVDQKAKRLDTSRTELYAMWRRCLEYLRGRLHGLGVNV